jgi:hypothetical protein
MATLEHLVASGKLTKHAPDLERLELPERVVYFSPEFETWIAGTLPTLPRDRGRDLLPFEQVEQLLYDFVIGRPMVYSVDYRKLDPHPQHVWELKTEDIRLFGWFPRKCHFVIVAGIQKKSIPKAKDYAPLIQSVVQFRDALDLDAPKALAGVTHNDIF